MSRISHPLCRVYLISAFVSLWPQSGVFSQTDPVIVVSQRVGSVIDSTERSYFGLFPQISDSREVRFVRTREGVMQVQFANPEGVPITIDSARLADLVLRIEYAEAFREGIPASKVTEVTENEQGQWVDVLVDSARLLSGELLFADVHGIVIRDSVIRVISAAGIRAITTDRSFGTSTEVMAHVGLGVGVAAYGVAGALGNDVESVGGVFLTGFFTLLGAALGLLVDIVSSDEETYFEKGDRWEMKVLTELQSESRYPLGTPELKRMLGEVHEPSMRLP